jgi:drug/metabolite transporter (DMT)-like permease
MQDTGSVHTFPRHLIWPLVGLTLGWGLNWPAMKVAVSEMAPMRFRTLCLLAGAAGLFSIARANSLPIRIPRGQKLQMVAIALVNMTGWNIFAIYGVSLMASGRAAILGYTMPAWAVVLSAWLLDEPLTTRRVLGVALGMGGMTVLLGRELLAVGRSPLGALCMVLAAAAWAMGTVLIKRWPVNLPTSSFTAWQMLIGVVPIVVIALVGERGTFNPFALSLWPMLGALYNLVVAFNFCYWAWNKIAVEAPVGVSSLAVMMIPVVGVFSGALLLGETPHWLDYAALVLVVGSLATVLLPPRSATGPPVHEPMTGGEAAPSPSQKVWRVRRHE